MEEMKLFLEGIENKISRLLIKQNALIKQIEKLEAEKAENNKFIDKQKERIEELEKKIEIIGAVKALDKEDNAVTKHKIDEILRDIDKCLFLLNK